MKGTPAYTALVNDLYAKAEERLNAALHFGIDTGKTSGDTLTKGATAAKNLAEGFVTVGRSAIAAAEAIGQMDARTAASLQNVVSLGEGIGKLFVPGQEGAGIAEMVTSLGALAGSLFGGGQSAEAHQQQQAELAALQKNSDALDRVAQGFDRLSSSLSGSEFAGVFAGLQNRQPGGFSANYSSDFTLEDVLDVAKQVGVTFASPNNPTPAELQQLLDVMTVLGVQFGKFSDGFDGQLAKWDADKQIFGHADATSDIGGVLGAGAGSSPIIASLNNFFETLNLGTQAGRDALRAKAQDIYKEFEDGDLTPADIGLTNDQFTQLMESVIGDIDTLDAAAPKLSDKLSALSQDFTVMGETNPSDQLKDTIGAMGQFSPALAHLADGLDLTTTDGLDQFTARLRTMYGEAKDSTGALDMGTLSLSDFLDACVQLATGATAAAGAIITSAQQIAGQISTLQTQYSIDGTSSADPATGYAAAFGFGDLGDLSTQAGVDAAKATVRAIFDADPTNKDVATEVSPVLQALGGITFAAGAAGDATAADIPTGTSAAGSASAVGVESLTTRQGDEWLDIGRQQLGVLRDIEATMAAYVSIPVPQPVGLGALSNGIARAQGSGDITIRVTTGPILVDASAGANPTLAGASFADSFVREIDRALGDSAAVQKLLRGDITVPKS